MEFFNQPRPINNGFMLNDIMPTNDSPFQNDLTNLIERRFVEIYNEREQFHANSSLYENSFMLKIMNKTFIESSKMYQSLLFNQLSSNEQTATIFQEFNMAISNEQYDKAIELVANLDDGRFFEHEILNFSNYGIPNIPKQYLSPDISDKLDKILDFYEKYLQTTNGQKNGYKAFPTACQSNNTELIRYFLTRPDTDVNYIGFGNNSGLAFVIANNNLEAVKLILEKTDVDVNRLDSEEISPIFRTLYNNQSLILEELLNYPTIDLSVTDVNGNDLLAVAIESNKLVILNKIINSKKFDLSSLGDKINLCFSYLLSSKLGKAEELDEALKITLEFIDVNYRSVIGETFLMTALSKFFNDKIKEMAA